MSLQRRKSTKDTKQKISPFKDYWQKNNYIILITGLIFIIIGYILMAQDPWYNPLSLSVSPIVLLIAYLIIIPLSIIFTKKNSKKNTIS
ncbi:MAG: DUF3098 domain-containing protein [Melioribacter sp.]|nr:DUF3098 domain-containing protein [Melioribacter sp.]